MHWQKLHIRLYEAGKMHLAEQLLHRPKLQQGQFQLPAIVNPTRRSSPRDRVWLSVGVFFGVVYVLLILISMQVGAHQVRADQGSSTPTTTFSSSTDPTPTPQTTTLNSPTISKEKVPSILPTLVPTAEHPPITSNPTPAPCPGVNCNPWGYNFIPGNLIYNPPAGFCYYFACSPDFNRPHHMHSGYVVECYDGMYSQYVGRQETCSLHSGILRVLYAH